MSRSGGRLIDWDAVWVAPYERWREQTVYLSVYEVGSSIRPWWFAIPYIIDSIHEAVEGVDWMMTKSWEGRFAEREIRYREIKAALIDLIDRLEESTWRPKR